MDIAIIGAGLSGLACAHELKRYGIKPTIFEKKPYIGEVLDFSAIVLNLFCSPIKKPILQLREKFGIKLSPIDELNELVLVSPQKSYTIHGKLGHVFLRSSDKDSIENQIMQAVNLPVNFNTNIDIDEIKKDYDFVILANGNLDTALRNNIAIIRFDAYVRVAKVKGTFKTNSLKVWMNTKYAKHGFVYLTAKNSEDARIIMTVDNINRDELDYYWKEFLNTEKIDYPIYDIKDLPHPVGTVFPLNVGNVYYTGLAGGLMDSLLGFGSMAAVFSGATAAHCIVNGLDYNKELMGFVKDFKNKDEFRKVFNSFDNKGISKFVAIENLPVIKQIIFNVPFTRAVHGTFLARAYNYLIKK